MAIIQFRVDDDLKNQATTVYEKLGIDLSTAMRMFLKKSVSTNGIPFLLINDEKAVDASKAIKALEKMQSVSEANGNSNMSLEDINEEINQARKHKSR